MQSSTVSSGPFTEPRPDQGPGPNPPLLDRDAEMQSTTRAVLVNLGILIFGLLCLVLLVRLLWKRGCKTKRTSPDAADKPCPAGRDCTQHGLHVVRKGIKEAKDCTESVWQRSCGDPNDEHCQQYILSEFSQQYKNAPRSYFDVLNAYLRHSKFAAPPSRGTTWY